MNEINNNGKSEINFGKAMPKNPKVENNGVNAQSKEINTKDYKEAVQAPGAEALGRTQVMMNTKGIKHADNIENDIKTILDNPKILAQSDIMFDAALKAGYSYPDAAKFATTELV